MRRGARSRWYGPGVFAGCGLALAGADVAGHQPGQAIFDIVLFGAIALVLAVGGRSETVRAVRGDLDDERLAAIQLRAVALAGWLVIVAVVLAFIVQLARGRSGAPYSWLAAIGGVTYAVAYVRGLRR